MEDRCSGLRREAEAVEAKLDEARAGLARVEAEITAIARQGLYAIRAARHKRLAIMGLFAGHAEWLAHLWPLPPGGRYSWDAERAAGALLDASARCGFGEPPQLPGAEIIPFRRPPSSGGDHL